ncbi:taste receptor type 2 member 40-like [Pleurodeles waltl]|uniref:taste receptor type 2 member 40-like n=1 Tax=Pleurodeles waltl TaxID=8319 RepID=UPI0037097784
MLSWFAIVSLAIFGIGTVTGVITNAFILVANFLVTVYGLCIQPGDLIITTLGLSNICFQLTMAVNDFCAFLWNEVYFSFEVYAVINVLILFTIISSFWFTVCLCVFYCIQILIFTRPFLIKLKQNIAKLVHWLLLGSTFTSLTLSLPAAWCVDKGLSGNMISSVTVNITLEGVVPRLNPSFLLFSILLGCTLPLILVGISNALIIISLCSHAKNMMQGSSSGAPRGEAGLRAVRTVTSLLLIYILFYVSEVFMFLDMFPPASPWMDVCLAVIYLYSPVQSVILILGSPKLKAMSIKILHHSRCQRRKLEGKQLVILTLPAPE